jgi:hypothetical protein
MVVSLDSRVFMRILTLRKRGRQEFAIGRQRGTKERLIGASNSDYHC